LSDPHDHAAQKRKATHTNIKYVKTIQKSKLRGNQAGQVIFRCVCLRQYTSKAQVDVVYIDKRKRPCQKVTLIQSTSIKEIQLTDGQIRKVRQEPETCCQGTRKEIVLLDTKV
jgi:hypothetical protein